MNRALLQTTTAKSLLISAVIASSWLAGAAQALTVTGVSPNAGYIAGNQTVTITGTGFQSSGNVQVWIGAGQALNAYAQSDTVIYAITPGTLQAGVVDVGVSNVSGSDTLAGSYKYFGVNVSKVQPSVGPLFGGQTVTITGSGFQSGGNLSVYFGNQLATNAYAQSDTVAYCIAPAQMKEGAVSVRLATGRNYSSNFSNGDFSLEDAYTYKAVTVTGISPNTGWIAGGQTVTITGSGFQSGGNVQVRFGNQTATQAYAQSDTVIYAISPAQNTARTVGVSIATGRNYSTQSTNGDATLACAFTYKQATVTGISPAAGPLAGNQTVTITGAGFQSGGNIVVRFGNRAAQQAYAQSDNVIYCIVPAGVAAGSVTVQVITGQNYSTRGSNGAATAPSPYTYTN
jgi:hypothetical protein